MRLQLYQWQEAITGQWVDKEDLPADENTMLVMYQTGKGSDHLVPVIFSLESLSAIKFLTKEEVQKALNATKNRHRVASLLANLKLSEQEKDLIYKHFGHSEKINQIVYQASPGS